MAQRTRRPNHRLDDVRTRGLLRSGLPATLLLAVASVAALALAIAAPALAQIPGATYNGTFTSQTGTQTFFGGITLQWGTKTAVDPNAPISFNVSDDGSTVTDVTLPSVVRGAFVGYGPGSAAYCEFFFGPGNIDLSGTYTTITNGAFDFMNKSVGGGIRVQIAGPDPNVPGFNNSPATFTGANGENAQGTLRVATHPNPNPDPIYDECTTGYIPWTASTTAQPPPDGTAVEGSASAKKTQKQKGKKIVVKFKVKNRGSSTIRIDASGKIKVAKKSYKLKPPFLFQFAYKGESKTVKLTSKAKDAKKIAKALKKGKKAEAKLSVKLIDVATDNKKTQKLNVKLKR